MSTPKPSPPAAPVPNVGEQVTIRPLRAEDCETVAELMAHYARKEILLWRTADDLKRHLHDFLVAELPGRVVGCVGLRNYGRGLFEVRSLAVAPELRELGIGKRLLAGAIAAARRHGCQRLFALTTSPDFFCRNGFSEAARSEFPEKIWSDCRGCFKRDRCDEVAVRLLLEPAPQG